jgi:diadenosine tetraphosphatase ApaH/serine/threonine PP2A family protein phosphatase
MVHGTPTLNTVYFTRDRPDAFCTKMAQVAGLARGDVLAFGHTHVPWHRAVDGIHFVNAGSVGRPKDGDWRACYAIVDVGDEISVEFRRVEYDIDRAANGIRDSALPAEFAEYLRRGGAAAALSAPARQP